MKQHLLNLILVFTIFFSLSLFAQDEEFDINNIDQNEEAQAESSTISQLIDKGGKTMIVLTFMSIFLVAIAAYLFMYLRIENLAPSTFLRKAESIAETHDFEALEALCQENHSAAALIIGAAAEEVKMNSEVNYRVIRDAVEDEGSRQAEFIWQKIQYIMDVAVIAPMAGLLGTVLGMRDAFSGLQSQFGSVKPVVLANGVAKALITTAAGLILGIGGMILYGFFRGLASRLISQIESRCSKVIKIFASKNS